MDGNRLLPILGTVAVAAVVLVGVKSCKKAGEPKVAMTEIPKAPAPDADSPADTVRTLTAEVASMKSQNEALARQNEELLRQRTELAQQVTTQVRDELRRDETERHDSAYEQLTQRLNHLAGQIDQIGQAAPVPGTAGNAGTGGGLALNTAPPPPQGIQWIDPLDGGSSSVLGRIGAGVHGVVDRARAVAGTGGSLLHDGLDTARENPLSDHVGLGADGAASGQPAKAPPPEPAYTVPRNATLIGSTGMTALIGRIPLQGKVEDPYPFKVIVGRDNLAANGLEMPDLDGMIFSGEATGDWALACVRGTLQSVTYLFQDGTIRTLSSDDQSLQQKAQESAVAAGQAANPTTQAHKPLGWISDKRGIPCISGERITNAGSYLLGRLLASGISAAGQAFARAQTTVTTSPLTGGSTGVVTGNPYDFAIGQTGAGAGQELAAWLRERQSQSFDVVYADTGAELAIHIDRELPIDYEPNGRRLDYARVQATHTAADRPGSGLD